MGGDYISRDAAILWATKALVDDFDAYNVKVSLQKIRAADVVEVVRCKDCIYWEEYDGSNGELNCGYCSELLDRTTYYLFFCADGTRKDGDED